jgi:hypothetical protein
MIHEISTDSYSAASRRFNSRKSQARSARTASTQTSSHPVNPRAFRTEAALGFHWDSTVLDRLQSPLTHYHE